MGQFGVEGLFAKILLLGRLVISYLSTMEQAFRGVVSKIIKINSLLVLFALIVVAIVVLLWYSPNIGLSQFSKNLLVIGLFAVIVILGLLGAFRPDALLLTSEHKYQLERLKLGDSEGLREYRQGELLPSGKSELLENGREVPQ